MEQRVTERKDRITRGEKYQIGAAIVGVLATLIGIAVPIWLADKDPPEGGPEVSTSGGNVAPTQPVPALSPTMTPSGSASHSDRPTNNPRNISRETAPSSEGRKANTSLSLTIHVDSYGQVGPNTWKQTHTLRVSVSVFDKYGELEKGCYARFAASMGGEIVQKNSGSCELEPTISTRSHGPGRLSLRFDVTTSWGAEASKTKTINVVSG